MDPQRMRSTLSMELQLSRSQQNDSTDEKFGYSRLKSGQKKLGWLINMHSADILTEENKVISAVDYYFIEDDGGKFKVSLPFSPYFYIAAKVGNERELATFLSKKFVGLITAIETVDKEDLDLANHLSGLRRKYMKLTFRNVRDLVKVKREILTVVQKNKSLARNEEILVSVTGQLPKHDKRWKAGDLMEEIVDIREHDVPYHIRASIDGKINVGQWYNIKLNAGGHPELQHEATILHRPDAIVLAFDIETTKLPLKFPDSSVDAIMMISYMVDGQGYLITNRSVVSQDIEDFEYSPKPGYEGPQIVMNEPDEESLLKKWYSHIKEIKPDIFVTYNGDFFDWPFIEARSSIYGMQLTEEIGFAQDSQNEYKSRYASHMDVLRWVKRDSYLPVGSQNLKAVTKAKLRYNPVELDPEEMCRMAVEAPKVLADYSVSDAVATYYLYMQYVHPFIFALCTIIPMEPDEVLRKGSGTLCETLLMVQAFHANIIFPNKQEQVQNRFTADGHLLESETYVGGHVEALESGVFRNDIPCRFRLVPDALQNLIEEVEPTIRHVLEQEEMIPLSMTLNFSEVCDEIKEKLKSLRDTPSRLEKPMIYHLDVGAMYPNIILTNRLQPTAMVDEITCASCDFNKPGANCQRTMDWMWRGDFLPASRSEFQIIRQQLEVEEIAVDSSGSSPVTFHSLPTAEQSRLERKRLSDYCHKAYKKLHVTREELRQTVVCQRENSFYVDTVRAFRDRRYEFKGLLKVWKKKLAQAMEKGDPIEIKHCKGMEVLYDSLQLAHKCILNSFYGYVMRKGARWFSMEMAGIVCYTGANIITEARELVEQIGRPLELDTDGIWCILPASFPENFQIKTTNLKKPKVTLSYPGAVLNYLVKNGFTNKQYHELVDVGTCQYEVRSENSIFFEVDGPYKAMILPASKEEGKKLKKRYAVFNEDGTLAELKGFEVKRRGELQLIKIFQSSVFEAFLQGSTLESCYEAVAQVADYWLDILYSKGENLPDQELFDLISENRSMSKSLEEYGVQKSTSISTAKRLAEFLGDQMVKDKGLSCRFIISKRPEGAPVTERAIPLAIFQTEEGVKKHYLRRWLKCSSLSSFDIREILDWNYYIDRLNSCIQKIITIPAALQGVSNPVKRCPQPDWLHKKLLEREDIFRQQKIDSIFKRSDKIERPKMISAAPAMTKGNDSTYSDLEDMGRGKRESQVKLGMLPAKKARVESMEFTDEELSKSWRDVLGKPPSCGSLKDMWVAFHKRKWRFQSLQRLRKRKAANQRYFSEKSTAMLGSFPAEKASFFKRQAQAVLNDPWQIIQVVEDGTPGRVKVWAILGKELQCLKVEVPKVFYVNTKTAKDGEFLTCRKVNRILPHCHPAFHLYEYTVPEALYEGHSSELAVDLSSPDTEGIYETQVSTLFRALLHLGCVCLVNRMAVHFPSSKDLETFELNQLDFKTVGECSYLRSSDFHKIFIWHVQFTSRAVIVLFFTASKRAFAYVMNSSRTNQMPNLSSTFIAEQRKMDQEYAQDDDMEGIETESFSFDIKVEKDIHSLFRAIQRLLRNHKQQKRGPTVIVLCSQLDQEHLKAEIPILQEFPIIEMPRNKLEKGDLSALDWQKQCAVQSIRAYLSMEKWLQVSIENARYFHIPVGNIPASDAVLFASDVFFARLLKKANQVLWLSTSPRPDLGGREEDDNRLVADFEQEETVEVNNGGCCSTVCVEISIDGLAVNSVLQSHHVHDAEGVGLINLDSVYQPSLEGLINSTLNAPPVTSYDESAQCANAMRVLKNLVFSWLQEVTAFKNPLADNQLVHFYRWIHNSSSLLFDPSLCRVIHRLMKKVFMQLISEFQKLGSNIVYADFSKLVICTKKTRVEDAKAYVDFVLNTLQTRDLFRSIELTPVSCWEYLLWMDKVNYGGIRGSLPSEASLQVDKSSASFEASEEKRQVEMNWNICKFLANYGSCQNFFQVVIAGHIHAVFTNIQEELKRQQKAHGQLMRGSEASEESTTTPATVEFAQNRVKNELAVQLFSITQKIQKMNPGVTWDDRQSSSQQDLIFSGCTSKNPALEFVKTVCAVLSLDKSTHHQVNKLRRDLLKLINVGEFSEDACFQDPSLPFVIPEVTCDYCNSCRDIDLCRDPLIVRQPESDSARICCPNCNEFYSLWLIEDQLLNMLNRRSLALCLQDIKCSKCRAVKADHMSSVCDCAGSYFLAMEERDFPRQLQSFKAIARHYGLQKLLTQVQYLDGTKHEGNMSVRCG